MADKNHLYYGDNLDVLARHIKDESVDLVYLDPPFQSGRNYNVLFAEKDGAEADSQIKAFEDTWEWTVDAVEAFDSIVRDGGRVADAMQALHAVLRPSSMLAYLAMMAPRLVALRRVLKPTGTLYLHCDPTASHYLKVIMDAVFGPEQFLSEIIWKRTGAHNSARRWGPIHDVILMYAKTDKFKWCGTYQKYEPGYIEDHFNCEDERGRYQPVSLTGPGVRTGDSGKAWRDVDPTIKGRHWQPPTMFYDLYKTVTGESLADLPLLERLNRADAAGLIHWPKKDDGVPRFKQYAHLSPGLPVQDVILDIPPLGAQAAERLNYPTQKPEALLERLIKAATEEGDVVLDPFCGCGTTIAVAQRLRRKWIGIDITHLAISLIKSRLQDVWDVEIKSTYTVVGEPTDVMGAAQLASEDRHQFEHWALGLVGARASAKGKGSDRGIDGVLRFQEGGSGSAFRSILISVKSGGVKAGDVRDLVGTVQREKAAMGILITLEPATKPMRVEAASAGRWESLWGQHPRIQILEVSDLIHGARIDGPPMQHQSVTVKRAERHVEKGEQIGLNLPTKTR